MAYQNKKGFIVLEKGDLEHETPNWVSNFWEFITRLPKDKPYKSHVDITK